MTPNPENFRVIEGPAEGMFIFARPLARHTSFGGVQYHRIGEHGNYRWVSMKTYFAEHGAVARMLDPMVNPPAMLTRRYEEPHEAFERQSRYNEPKRKENEL